MDAMTYAAHQLSAHRATELQREIALRAAHAARAEARRTPGVGGRAADACVQGELALAGPSA